MCQVWLWFIHQPLGWATQKTVSHCHCCSQPYNTLPIQVRSQSLSEDQSCLCCLPGHQDSCSAALAALHGLRSAAVSSVAMDPIFFSTVSSFMVPMCHARLLDSLWVVAFQTLSTLFWVMNSALPHFSSSQGLFDYQWLKRCNIPELERKSSNKHFIVGVSINNIFFVY